MNARRRRLLQGVLSCPTSPFCERAVIEHVRNWASRCGAAFAQDAAGNVLLSAAGARAAGKATWVFTAHMDHPGFVVRRCRGRSVWAQFRGGLAKEYFPASPVRLITGNGEFVATVATVRKSADRGWLDCRLELPGAADVPPGSIGMWDVPVFRSLNGRIAARACDDLAGSAAVLAAMEEIISRGVDAKVMGLLTRAEEAGFVGALAACRLGTIPAGAMVVGIETSKAHPAARVGGGVVIRVGDKLRTFNESLTAHISAVAAGLAKKKRNFRFIRQLMPGGTCESTVFCALGHTAGALALPLGNYHNQHPRGWIAPEFIDEGDFDCLVELLVALASDSRTPADTDADLRRRLDGLMNSRQKNLDEPGPWSPRR
jgi:endoglucanase